MEFQFLRHQYNTPGWQKLEAFHAAQKKSLKFEEEKNLRQNWMMMSMMTARMRMTRMMTTRMRMMTRMMMVMIVWLLHNLASHLKSFLRFLHKATWMSSRESDAAPNTNGDQN